MPKFSERLGLTTPRAIQLKDVDADLRVALWNWLCGALGSHVAGRGYWTEAAHAGLWDEVLHLPVDLIPPYEYQTREEVKTRFFRMSWWEMYDCVEYLLPQINTIRGQYDQLRNPELWLNAVLEREMSGYRAVRDQLVPITNPIELEAINTASQSKNGFDGSAEHIRTALALLGKKPEPDYRNSIKESISAIEAAVKVITGEKSGGIDKALAILERGGKLHSALKAAMSKLYGYSSDQDGIRHAMIEDPATTFSEAKFMLVTCSAFVNFLIESAR